MREEYKPVLKVSSPGKGHTLDQKIQAFVKNNLYEDLSDEEKSLLEKCNLRFEEKRMGITHGIEIIGTTEKKERVEMLMYQDDKGNTRYRGSINSRQVPEEEVHVFFEKYKRISQLQTEVGNITRTVFAPEDQGQMRKSEYIEMYRNSIIEKFLSEDLEKFVGEINLKSYNDISANGHPVSVKEGTIQGHDIYMSYTEVENNYSFMIDGLFVADKDKAKALFEKFYSA